MASGKSKPPLQSKKVCVIGAGMAGVTAARELQREGHAVTVMEQSAGVGGQWLYDAATDAADPLGAAVPVSTHSSMYASLRLISAREAMGFSDFEFLPTEGRDARRFPGHREVHLYLKDFCHTFGVTDAIRFRTRVLRVAMAPARRWSVRSVHLDDEKAAVLEEVFDAVVVATGHYSQPWLPSIEMREWRRRQLHSHWYRRPDPFRGEVVVMVGCGDSGKDIALDLRAVAKEVHLTTKSMEETLTPAMSRLLARHGSLRLHPQIDRLCEDGRVVFADGSFLDTRGAVTVDDNRVGPLFEHTFPPSLSFVGIPRKVLVPWFFEAQGKWVAQVLSGRKTLPPEEEMMRSVEEHYRAREVAGVPKKYTHDIGGVEPEKMYEFGKTCCDLAPIEDWKRELIECCMRNMDEDMETYRDRVDGYTANVQKGLRGWYGSSAQAAQPDHAAAHVEAQAVSMLALKSELKGN